MDLVTPRALLTFSVVLAMSSVASSTFPRGRYQGSGRVPMQNQYSGLNQLANPNTFAGHALGFGVPTYGYQEPPTQYTLTSEDGISTFDCPRSLEKHPNMCCSFPAGARTAKAVASEMKRGQTVRLYRGNALAPCTGQYVEHVAKEKTLSYLLLYSNAEGERRSFRGLQVIKEEGPLGARVRRQKEDAYHFETPQQSLSSIMDNWHH